MMCLHPLIFVQHVVGTHRKMQIRMLGSTRSKMGRQSLGRVCPPRVKEAVRMDIWKAGCFGIRGQAMESISHNSLANLAPVM